MPGPQVSSCHAAHSKAALTDQQLGYQRKQTPSGVRSRCREELDERQDAAGGSRMSSGSGSGAWGLTSRFGSQTCGFCHLALPPTGCVNLVDSLVTYRQIVNIVKCGTSKTVLPIRGLAELGIFVWFVIIKVINVIQVH